MTESDVNRKTEKVEKEFNEIFEMLKEALADRENPQARREIVQDMLGKEFKTGQIIRVVRKAFNCSPSTVERDIAQAKKNFLDYLRKNNQEEHLSKSVNRMISVIRQAYKDGDARAVIQASKHHDQLLGLIDTEISIGGKIDVNLDKIHDEIALKIARFVKSERSKRIPKKSVK